jgi:hypothetical protein
LNGKILKLHEGAQEKAGTSGEVNHNVPTCVYKGLNVGLRRVSDSAVPRRNNFTRVRNQPGHPL